jgi:hypothetical protein
MLVHAAIAFAPLAAASFLLGATDSSVLSIGPEVWDFLLWASLIGMLVLALPAALSGVSERNHHYANWLASHRIKLVLSVLLVVLVAFELVGLGFSTGTPALISWLALAIVFGNCALVFGLSYFGLKITLGRQALAKTSYKPDMDWEPPMDILSCVADFAADPPKLIDVQGESRQ